MEMGDIFYEWLKAWGLPKYIKATGIDRMKLYRHGKASAFSMQEISAYAKLAQMNVVFTKQGQLVQIADIELGKEVEKLQQENKNLRQVISLLSKSSDY